MLASAIFLEFIRYLGRQYDLRLIQKSVSDQPHLPYKPKFWQQAIRALLFTMQVAMAYMLML